MNISLLLHTVQHLRPVQVVYQVMYRICRHAYKELNVDKSVALKQLREVPIDKECCYSADKDKFCFLNIEDTFKGWNDDAKGMLWAYNLNYMDWLNQSGATVEDGVRWVERFIDELPTNRVGLDPYPIALRGINWMKFIMRHGSDIVSATIRKWNNLLYSQYALLHKKLEYHLLGNHLLENAFSLFMASLYFEDKRLFDKASRLLIRELNEQLLADGAHYEQSAMYHCILLDRLLDCYNFSISIDCFSEQSNVNDKLKVFAQRMLGHLESVVYADKTIPLLNDAAYGIAPMPTQIFDYAKRLGLEWVSVPMKECGYRKLSNEQMEAIVDVGNITATYQPGHTHADTFSYELRMDGKPFIVDTGISTYNKTERRQYERTSAAHNTVTINELNSSEVWGGFRVGKRAKVTILEDTGNLVKASHNGFGKDGIHTRTFQINVDGFAIIDEVSSNNQALSYIHLAPEVQVQDVSKDRVVTNRGIVHIHNAQSVEVMDEKVSTRYNLFQSSKIIRILFTKEMRYTICKQ